jgi:hypothetical protein
MVPARPPRRRACLLALVVAGCAAHAGSVRRSAAPTSLPYWQVSSIWRASPVGRSAGCSSLDAWVSKSGKTGLGLTVELRKSGACSAEILEATLTVAGQPVSAVTASPSTTGDREHRYLPFLFDNDRAWRSGVQDARVTLLVRAEGTRSTVTIPLRQFALQPHSGVLTQHETEAGCARVDAEVLDFQGSIVLRLDVSAARPGCRVRFAGVSGGRTGDPGPLELGPATDVWYSLPTRWVLSFRPAHGLTFKDCCGATIHLSTEDGKIHAVPLGISREFELGSGP